jgi:hypothetical protein
VIALPAAGAAFAIPWQSRFDAALAFDDGPPAASLNPWTFSASNPELVCFAASHWLIFCCYENFSLAGLSTGQNGLTQPENGALDMAAGLSDLSYF